MLYSLHGSGKWQKPFGSSFNHDFRVCSATVVAFEKGCSILLVDHDSESVKAEALR
jgi:hypothetical protein